MSKKMPGSPTDPRRRPARSNHASTLRPPSPPLWYTSGPPADTENTARQIVGSCCTSCATTVGSPTSLRWRAIEPLTHERRVAHVQELAVDNSRLRPRAHERLGRAPVERRDEDGALRALRRIARHGEVHEGAPVRKYFRPTMAGVSGAIDARDRLRLAAARRYLVDAVAHRRREQDDIARAPGPTASTGRIAQREHGSLVHIHTLQLAAHEEADCAAIRRPERKGGVVCAGDGTRLDGVEWTYPQPAPAGAVGGDEREPAAIGRQRRRSSEVTGEVETRARGAAIVARTTGAAGTRRRSSAPTATSAITRAAISAPTIQRVREKGRTWIATAAPVVPGSAWVRSSRRRSRAVCQRLSGSRARQRATM